MLCSIGGFLGAFGILVCLASPSVAGTADTPSTAVGWELERDVETPSYAVTEPASTNLNIDSVVLSCEQGPSRRGLQLRLYLSGAGPLAPLGSGKDLKDDPTVDWSSMAYVTPRSSSSPMISSLWQTPLTGLCHCCLTRF